MPTTNVQFLATTSLLSDGSGIFASKVLLILAFRSLPFVIYVTLIPRRSPKVTLGLGGLYIALIAALGSHERVVVAWSTVGLCYYAACACFLHWLSKESLGVRRLDAVLLFALLGTIFLVIPATLLRPIAIGTFLILGWELVFKGYSYVIEGGANRNSLQSCLFFFLVDPTIVLVQRARTTGGPEFDVRAAARTASGVLGLLAGLLLEGSFLGLASQASSSAAGPWLLPALVALGGIQLLTTYCKHSGVASIQIGLMRLCGYVAMERYNHPLLARRPSEFWERWNIYVAQWAKRYIFQPFALELARRTKRCRSNHAAQAALVTSVVVTFAGMGALHDLYTLAEQRYLTVRGTAFFVTNAGLLLVWASVEKLATARTAELTGRAVYGRSFGLGRAAFAILFLTLAGLRW